MKTITYNPETHVLVPREPSEEMIKAGKDVFCDLSDCSEEAESNDYRNVFKGMLAAAPQPEPNPNWCAGCSPDNCSGCGAEPVDSEPAMWVMKHIRSGDLAQAKPNQKALHPYMLSDAFPRYTTPQPDRTAELEQLRTRIAELEALLKEAYSDADEVLRPRVGELEKQRDELKLDLLISYGEAAELSGKVAELKAALKVARDSIDEFLVANDPTEFGCACDLSVGYLCGPCHADMQQQPLKIALAKINEVLKP